jgi:hypothetical protein
MKTFVVRKGTPGLRVTQKEGMDVETADTEAKKDIMFTGDHVLVDPVKVAEFGNIVYERGSLAAKLAKQGYYVFSRTAGIQSTVCLAVHLSNVEIS